MQLGITHQINGLAVALQAQGEALNPSWNYGDGTAAATGFSVTHTYAQAGTYTVTLTMTDPTNSATTQQVTESITVGAGIVSQGSSGATVAVVRPNGFLGVGFDVQKAIFTGATSGPGSLAVTTRADVTLTLTGPSNYAQQKSGPSATFDTLAAGEYSLACKLADGTLLRTYAVTILPGQNRTIVTAFAKLIVQAQKTGETYTGTPIYQGFSIDQILVRPSNANYYTPPGPQGSDPHYQTVNGRGTYTFDPIPAGQYRINTTMFNGSAIVHPTYDVTVDEGGTMTVTAGTTTVSPNTGRLIVQTGLPGVEVNLTAANSNGQAGTYTPTVTGADGSATFNLTFGGASSISGSARAVKNGYVTSTLNFQVLSGQTQTLTFTMRAG